MSCFEQAFIKKGLQSEWDQVIAVVVQPGVEFEDAQIHEYNRSEALPLTSAMVDFPNLVFEGHSTDYQTVKCLKAMVEDGIAILKVGPAMIFALREMLFALALIESEVMPIYGKEVSGFRDSLEKAMSEHPENWMHHYHGSDEEVNLAKHYSFSDRVRYYFATETVEKSIETLLSNLSNVSMPLTLLSQYVPVQYQKIRKGTLKNDAYEILIDGIITELDHYYFATYPSLD
ncbi:class II D-tagatose-bisphosphate aldolase non-catalytic subunit [Fusibacter ferrireducens]|uniref:Class II D-tagatose-bisphosphate aldolase, non-catalytic subunit n=1 Tax=Fusibacter ferrireducens TaxID=2785058 RepID=A0ABR9ZTV9_9FIRM|nr:class II D-tagatose-bisphosphate aldolase, non-catalytic subunit [Fusibacter ferrireducens]MBF4693588.1 class II D-tagatose-bisphosphate aldolase, non-catalytic subunit [Fusibacter ferrireducens]